MIKEAIDRVLSLSKPTVETYEGRLYADRTLIPIKDPLDSAESVSTLTGLVDLIAAKFNNLNPEQCFIHVESPKRVTLSELLCDKWGQRQIHIDASLPDYGRFQFGQYMEQESFMIGLQTFFVNEPDDQDMKYVLGIAGKLKAEQVQQSDDDGVSQNVVLRTGVVLAQNTTIKRTVKLRPYRTFREIQQPQSDLVFRLRNRKDEVPALALHIADGEMWQHEAMQSIKTYLQGKCPDFKVIA